MHIIGKICAWVLVVLVIGAVMLTGQAINVRNSWLAKADTLSTANAQKKESITKKEAELNQLVADRALLMRSFGRPFAAKNVTVSNPQAGMINVDLGTRDGLQVVSAEAPPVVYGFFIPQNGPSRYIGPFQVTDLRDSSSVMQFNKFPRAGDIQTWQQGAWRFWQRIPTQFNNRYENQWNSLISADERLTQAIKLDEVVTAQQARSNEQIAERVDELKGGDKLPTAEDLPPEDLEGLVKTLANSESARNLVLIKVDQLRRDIHAAQEKLQSLLDQSRQLVEKLPQPTVDTAAN
ncbi:MAG: hypothetical protein P8M30_06010 [Planctomycetaceae bacterium]|nr:hypothetical protein [Planctomycetaceae bacterium]